MNEQTAPDNTEALLETIRGVGGDPADLPFWQACEEGRFLLHRCDLCRRHYWPASRCIEHGDRAMQWVEATGRGKVYTYTVMHRAYTPDTRDKVPFAIAVVKLEEGPFYHTTIIDCAHDTVAVDMAVDVAFQRHDNGMMLPVFRPVEA